MGAAGLTTSGVAVVGAGAAGVVGSTDGEADKGDTSSWLADGMLARLIAEREYPVLPDDPAGFTTSLTPSFFGGTAGAGSLSKAADGAGGIAGVAEAADTACILLSFFTGATVGSDCATAFSTGTAGCALSRVDGSCLSVFGGLVVVFEAGVVVVYVDAAAAAGATFVGGGGGGGRFVAFCAVCCCCGAAGSALLFFLDRNMPLSKPLTFSTLGHGQCGVHVGIDTLPVRIWSCWKVSVSCLLHRMTSPVRLTNARHDREVWWCLRGE